MSHTDPEILALRALGETAGTAHDAEHAGSCAHCRAELARLTEVVRLARGAGPGEAPPPQVWDRIAAAVGTRGALNGPALNGPALNGPALNGVVPRTPEPAEPPRRNPRPPQRRSRGSPGRVGGWRGRWPAWPPG